MSSTVAIIGRPNVGKSTLFNRLTGTRHALVADIAGTTRDRREGLVELDDLSFTLIDTAGLEQADNATLEGRMFLQTRAAIDEADVLLMMVDARAGIIPEDEHFVAMVRESGKPVLLLVNKAEGRGGIDGALEAYSLGLGDPVVISAEHGQGIGELFDRLLPYLEEVGEQAQTSEVQMAVVGRPNAGKSTFINAILGEDRLLTGPEAGITRDAIAVPFTFENTQMKLIDTAGMRKKARIHEKLESLAVSDARRAIQFAHVVVLMVDATQPLEKQDNQIASLIAEEGRAMVLALNKWDLVPGDERKALLEEVAFQVNKVMPQFKGLPIVTVCAEKNKGLEDVLKAALTQYELWNRRIATGELNRWLEDITERHTPPLVKGKRLKIKYITQANTRPPSFALFVNQAKGLNESYRRYLVNHLREAFGLPGIPIRLMARSAKNPYAEKA